LLASAVLLALIKSIQFAVDSQALFYYDSGAFILNGLGLNFISFRSYVYGYAIRAFAVPFHSLRAIVAMQVVMGAVTAWLLIFALIRFLRVRPWIALAAGLAFAFDPVQIVHEHMVMAETSALLAMATFLVVALHYLERPSAYLERPAPGDLVLLSFLGILLVSLRTVYLPLVLATAVLLPIAGYFSSRAGLFSSAGLSSPAGLPRLSALALALVVSCGSTALFHVGYRYLTGFLEGRAPTYTDATGFFLLAAVAPIVEPQDGDASGDIRIAQLVAAGGLPLLNPNIRWRQLWDPEGLVSRIKTVFAGEGEPAGSEDADQAAQRIAHAAIRRNPLGFLGLGWHNFLGYVKGLWNLRQRLSGEDGTLYPPVVSAREAGAILSAFGTDVTNQHTWNTPSRRYHLLARYWCVFLLAAPFFTGLALWMNPANPQGAALLFVWTCLLLAASCLGAVEASYRYLHPFSFTGLAAAAMVLDRMVTRRERE
jgi:hypothetical protein